MRRLHTSIKLQAGPLLLQVYIHLTYNGKLRIDEVLIYNSTGELINTLGFFQLSLAQIRWLEYMIKMGVGIQWLIDTDADYRPESGLFPS